MNGLWTQLNLRFKIAPLESKNILWRPKPHSYFTVTFTECCSLNAHQMFTECCVNAAADVLAVCSSCPLNAHFAGHEGSLRDTLTISFMLFLFDVRGPRFILPAYSILTIPESCLYGRP
jgi:hypothetical protein